MADSAELFEAIAHPVRIKILKILEKQPSSFASLKRQLGFASSGNLDFHLKKLGGLVKVRDDGLYGLTETGREALLSIDEVEMRTEMDKRRIKMLKMPKEAFFLGLLELSTTASLLGFFLAVVHVPFSWNSLWGYLFFTALLFIGFCSSLGLFKQWALSWRMVLAKSALIISMSLFLLTYIWNSTSGLPSYVTINWSPLAVYYLVFVVAEIGAVIVALRNHTKDFLAIETGVKPSILAVAGSFLCMFSGVLLVILENGFNFPFLARYNPELTRAIFLNLNVTVFYSMFDPSILCGLLIIVGGVLILLRNNTLGAVISIIFGFFPPPPGTPGLPLAWTAYHVYDIVLTKLTSPLYLIALIAVVVGSLPIVGGLMALASSWKTRRYLRVHL